MQLFIQALLYKHHQLKQWLCRKLCASTIANLTAENEWLKDANQQLIKALSSLDEDTIREIREAKDDI